MKKTIKAADIKAITKKFNLSWDESDWVDLLADRINGTKPGEMCEDMHYYLQNTGIDPDCDNAIAAMVIYFTEKHIGEFHFCEMKNDTYLEDTFKAIIGEWYFKGMFLNQGNRNYSRFAKYFDWSKGHGYGDHHWGLNIPYGTDFAA